MIATFILVLLWAQPRSHEIAVTWVEFNSQRSCETALVALVPEFRGRIIAAHCVQK